MYEDLVKLSSKEKALIS